MNAGAVYVSPGDSLTNSVVFKQAALQLSGHFYGDVFYFDVFFFCCSF